MKRSIIDWIAFVLVVVGALNWGLVGLLNYNLVESLLGAWTMAVRTIYVLVGLGALWAIYMGFRDM
ncbi:MAG TPA: DUF378 domain-containing protein [Candidatus Nanoarchaeia archaeon]|nr:DUF378 domain-containing protein [Candidatus Nanoarchaeia archaeon]